MGLSVEEAYRILEIPRGSSQDEIRSSYKKLALKWHPDKHSNSPEATMKFQEVSSAYKRLTSDDDDDSIVMSPADMFDLFAHIFFANGMFGCCPGHRHNHDSDCDNDLSDDDDLEDELFHGIASRLRSKYERRDKPTVGKGTPAHNLSEAEAMKNAEELIQEEEKERKKAEKRRAKKKRNKERKKNKDKEKEPETKKDGKENRQDNGGGGGDSKNNSNIKKSTDQKNNNLSNDTTTSKKNITITNGLREKSINDQNPQASKKESGHNKNRHEEDSDSHTEEPDWDTSSAFFAHAAGHPMPTVSSSTTNPTTNITTPSTSQQKQSDYTDNKNGPVPAQGQNEQMDPMVLKSRQVAVHGNEMANVGNYQAAVDLFTEAISLDSRDFRFFGNRSYCYDRMGQFEKALQDANVAITLAPDWPKGYFRRGRALAGLKLFSDGESSFSQVLKLDKHCEDAMFELARVRVQQLEEMGFPFAESEAAINSYGTVQAALEALLAGKVKVTVNEEIYMSDGESEQNPARNRISESSGPCLSLWVGNVDPEQVSERHLIQLFSRCAKVDNVRLLPKRFCAFVNFHTAEGAAIALEKLQGYEIGGQRVLLRYPNNTGAPGTENAPIRKPAAPASQPASQPAPERQVSYSQPKLSAAVQASKVTGPVNGDECYFWRTSGCAFGDKCKYAHVLTHKSVDLKKVEAKYGGRLRLQNPNVKS